MEIGPSPAFFCVSDGFAQEVDDGAATEGHPYDNGSRTIGFKRNCRGGPLWPPLAPTLFVQSHVRQLCWTR